MYRPPAFIVDDAAAVVLIDASPLAQLVVLAEGVMHATPVPMIVRGTSLVGHVARGNPVWRFEGDALAMFTGPDAYVSPRWYEGKRTDGKVVPTWNYTTVHARGRLIAHDEPEWKLELVSQLTAKFESVYDDPWAVTDAPADYVEGLLRAIVGIEILDVTFEGKSKLSQNRSAADQAAVTEALGFGPSR